MKLQTNIPLETERNPIDYSSKVLLLGSCFVENMGAKLDYYKFQSNYNPFGIIFHPIAIERLVTRAINEESFSEEDIFYHNEQWHCFDVHSSFSNSDKNKLLKVLNETLVSFKKEIISATHIIATYGTAWVYRFIETDQHVANCHKVQNKKFLKELLTPEEISISIENTCILIKDINPNVIFIHTVSPVRHTKDGMVENTRSKSHLLTGVHILINPRDRMHYFPAYEIMMDQLRDYRFYAEDLVHPNNTAIEIIWNAFKTVWVATETEEIQKKIGVVQSGLAHRPVHPSGEAHQLFLKDLQQKIDGLSFLFPHITF